MRVQRKGCPKCTGDLYIDQDFDERRILPPEWVCLQCGWRQAIQPRASQPLAG
ncbi:MAG TPA: hypothetical protein VH916_11800 [Dehalococcoidia bacterium]|jgi:hypothetical protein